MSTNTISDSLLSTMNATSTTTSTSSEDSIAQTEEQFLTLLVAQMQNQDPLDPLDNAELTSQLAQLSTVTGINELNGSLETVLSELKSSQVVEAADMIGHGVFVPGDTINLQESQSVFGVSLESGAENLVIEISDADGQLVRTMTMGEQDSGIVPLVWDGKTDEGTTAADGTYTFTVSDAGSDTTLSSETLSFGEVVSVTLGDAGVEISINGVGTALISDVREIL